MKVARFAAFLATASLSASAALADEGMWTFDAFPTARVQKEYGWAPDQAWLDRVRSASVRLTGGCSASFVSATGLILTNHHCVASCVEQNSTAKDNILDRGYVAGTAARERKCAGQQAEVVTAIRDVTPEMKAAIGGATGEAAVKARNAATAQLEKANCPDMAANRCQVVTLYGGGQYKLYTYRKYDDVRLVWAPEARAPQFGGDPDNFNFPRYSLDASFLRAYENGKPAATPQHLTWTARAPVDGELTFVVGNPGSTQRLFTTAQLAMQRELVLPSGRHHLLRASRPVDCRDAKLARPRCAKGTRRSKGSRTASRSISAARRRSTIRPSATSSRPPKLSSNRRARRSPARPKRGTISPLPPPPTATFITVASIQSRAEAT